MSDSDFAEFIESLSKADQVDLILMIQNYRPIKDTTFFELAKLRKEKPAAYKLKKSFMSPEAVEMFEKLTGRFELAV